MVEAAAHLTDHVFPRLPVRQWVLSVLKRLRYFMQRDGAALHIGAIAFIHRSNFSLNAHMHFHVCVVDGVFEEVARQTDAQSSSPGIVFHPASANDATAVAQVQAYLRRRILRYGAHPPLPWTVCAKRAPPEPVPPKRSPAHYLWAVLIARIYEVFPLLCPKCGGQMRLIAFITEGAQIRRILDHIGMDSEPPQISPARGPPLWDDCSDAQTDEGVHIEPDWDLAAQPAPDFEVDQRISW